MLNRKRALEEYLVARARTGDRAAAGELVALRGPRLYLHACRLLGDRDEARDAVQDAWVEILRGLPRLTSPAAFPAWATRIVTRRVARIIRARQKGRRLEAALIPLADDAAAPAGESLALRSALSRLPPDQAATVALFYLEDMSLAEVATALDIPEGTVKSRLSTARASLRDILEGETR